MPSSSPSRQRSPTTLALEWPMQRDMTGRSSKGASKRGSRDRSPGTTSELSELDLEFAPNLSDLLRYQEQQQPDSSISSLMQSFAMPPADVARSGAGPTIPMKALKRAVPSPTTILDQPLSFSRARPTQLRTRAVLGAELRGICAGAPRKRAPPNPTSGWVDWRDVNGNKRVVPRKHPPRRSPASSLDSISLQSGSCGYASSDEASTVTDRHFPVNVPPALTSMATRRADQDERLAHVLAPLPTGTSLVFHPTLGRLRRLPMPPNPRLQSPTVVPAESMPVRMVKH